MDLDNLTPLFDDNELAMNINPKQVAEFYEIYKRDFIDNQFIIGGKKIKIVSTLSNITDLKMYPETFAHIITRKSKGVRYYMADRANRIHWIKEILLSHPCDDIKFYLWRDDEGVCKYHYWLLHKKFMVVLKDIGKDAQIVTSFCVDDVEMVKYFERYKRYLKGDHDCK